MIKKIIKNTFFLSISQLTARAIGFLYLIFLARMLKVEEFGLYAFVFSFILNFVPVADFGIERLIIRDIPRKPQKINYYLARLLPLKTALALLAYSGALVLGIILGQTKEKLFYLAIFGLILLPQNITSLLTNLKTAQEKMEFASLAIMFIQILTVSLGSLFVFFKIPLAFLFWAAVFANLAVALFLLVKSSSLDLKLAWVFDKKFCRSALSQSWAFGAMTIMAVFYLRTSTILVGVLKGDYFTGLFSSAIKFIEGMILIPQSLALALFPLSSKLFIEDKIKLKKMYLNGLLVLFFASLPFFFVFRYFSKAIIGFAYGQEYLSAAPVLSVLAFSAILFFVNTLAGNIIQNSPKYKQYLFFQFFNFLIAVGLCLVFIPRWSILGAAWAVVGGELVALAINNCFVWWILRN